MRPPVPEERLRHTPDEPPPFLGAWKRVYLAIIVYLALLITAFYIFTRAFSA